MISSDPTSILGSINNRQATSSVDCRARLLVVLIASVAALVLESWPALALMAATGVVYLSMLRRWRMQFICYIMLIAMAVMSLIFIRILALFMPVMRQAGVVSMIVPFLRMAIVFHAVMALALTVRLQDVLVVLKNMHTPRCIYLPLAVTVRFLPGLIHDVRQLHECLRVRGYRGMSLFRPRLWILPLLFRTLHLSDELAIAAELKGVGYGRAVSQAMPSFWSRQQLILAPIVIVVLVGTVLVESQLRYVPGMSAGRLHGGSRQTAKVVQAPAQEANHD